VRNSVKCVLPVKKIKTVANIRIQKKKQKQSIHLSLVHCEADVTILNINILYINTRPKNGPLVF